MNYKATVSKKFYIAEMLRVLNPILKLSNKKRQIIQFMIEKDIEILNTENRIKVREGLNLDEISLNSYISRMKNKNGVLIKTSKGITINPELRTAIKDSSITITFETH